MYLSSCFLLHRYQTLNVATTDGTRVFSFDERFPTLVADAVVTTRHNESVFLCVKTDQAFFLLLILFNYMLLSRNSFVLIFHSVDRFHFKWKPIN